MDLNIPEKHQETGRVIATAIAAGKLGLFRSRDKDGREVTLACLIWPSEKHEGVEDLFPLAEVFDPVEAFERFEKPGICIDPDGEGAK